MPRTSYCHAPGNSKALQSGVESSCGHCRVNSKNKVVLFCAAIAENCLLIKKMDLILFRYYFGKKAS